MNQAGAAQRNATSSETRQLLIAGSRELGLALSVEQQEAFLLYLSELKKWNSKINLTAVHAERDMVIKHLLDSLSFHKGFGPTMPQTLLDMGSGAGFPALPLKIAFPDLAITMVESIKKKAAFLRHIIRTLGLSGAEVLDRRVEDLPESYNNRFQAVTARAFADMEKALYAGARFLVPGGSMILSRGPEETVDAGVVNALTMTVQEKIALVLPQSDYKRVIWVLQKT